MEGDLGVENYPLGDYLRKTYLGAMKSSGGAVGLGTVLKTTGKEAVRGAAQGAFGKTCFFSYSKLVWTCSYLCFRFFFNTQPESFYSFHGNNELLFGRKIEFVPFYPFRGESSFQ